MRDEDFTNHATKAEAEGVYSGIRDVSDNRSAAPVLSALACAFIAVCDHMDVEPTATLEQLQELLERGDLGLTIH